MVGEDNTENSQIKNAYETHADAVDTEGKTEEKARTRMKRGSARGFPEARSWSQCSRGGGAKQGGKG